MTVLRPSRYMKTLYFIYMTAAIILGYLSWAIPLTVYAWMSRWSFMELLLLVLYTPLVALTVFTLYWINRYYNSIVYELTDDEIIVSKGVFWRVKSIVPYNRITNIDVVQGPLSRLFGIATLKIQTAGYGGPGPRVEAELGYLENYENIKEEILEKVKNLRPVATETGEVETPTLADVVAELKRIRKLLEKQMG
ncbi:MAG: hypothetical protein DRJ47_06980 [Thermoprotei archaeon]|nr:MAG: hypothetical protein DRJ47_06980 [Thermoprotei archaeon]